MTTAGVRARIHAHPLLLDAVVSVVVVVVDYFFVPSVSGNPAPTAAELALIGLTLAAVTLRHRWPVRALALTVAGASIVVLLYGIESVATLAPLVALYAVALRSDRRTTLLAWASSAAVLAAAGALGALAAPGDGPWQDALQVVSWSAAVAAVGNGLRNRRAYLAAVEERAARAERTREEEARRRVAEERMRIARDLHDVVAHHIAVVTVQAGVAQHLMTSQPEAATEALGTVRRSAAAVLEELGDILSVLRGPGEPTVSGAPAPGLARLDALIESFAAAGLEVDWSLSGAPQDLAPTVDLVAYRVLEEGLTNALKYGTGTAHLSVEYRTTTLVLQVRNTVRILTPAGSAHETPDGPAPSGSALSGTGHGLLGMRERAAAVGGSLTAAPTPAGTFLVTAELPLRAAARP
ncbi:sensor histidine kinase [Blastococcus xanthinilyticus]|uniref:histidine kinase n=1 Tax=Blastococcus xanthinilyticus TaxID=1564164 RepID=A0A5S5D496_9ACTN|nr:histidine kinase [Blastococcus xanthinilyticus]TYP90525.1 signal transduction histidine kinase [Blastococcus xanthinilyticus]